MQKSEKDIQQYIWEHKDELSDMQEIGSKPSLPDKKPWEYEPWELIYYQIIHEYYRNAENLYGLRLFGCEVGMPKDGDSTIRSMLGSS